jgi:hypothetical protein
MDRVLYGACQDLVELKREGVEAVPELVVGPAVKAQDALARVDDEPPD